jgi:3',5'-cyclic AMP phosphodiesterase CpdA
MPASDLTIIHLSELHYHAEGTRHLEHLDSHAEALNTLEHLRRYAPRPSLFVITGDLVMGLRNAEVGYPRVKQLVEQMAAEFEVPVLLALGNGDTNEPFRRIVLGEAAPVSSSRYFHSHVVDGLKIIVLDSHADGEHFGDFDDEQLAWLSAELSASPEMDFILAFHHPPGNVVFGRDHEDVINAPRLAEVIAGHNVIGILNGHFHKSYLSNFAGVPVAITKGTSTTITWSHEQQMIHERTGGGYNIVHVRDRRMHVSFIDVTSERPTLRWEDPRWHDMKAERLARE